jgi:hypothetical protein
MKVTEIINEVAVGTLHYPTVTIVVDDHAFERAQGRGVDPHAVDYTLRRLDKIYKKLEQMEVNKRFWVYDWSREISLGLRRISSTEMTFMLKSVLPKKASITPQVDMIISL